MKNFPYRLHNQVGKQRSYRLPIQDGSRTKGEYEKAPNRSIVAQKNHLKYAHAADKKKNHVKHQPPDDARTKQSPDYIYHFIGKQNGNTTQKGT